MPKQSHSDKALETFRLMGTTPADWKQADIEWTQQMRSVPTPAQCPECRGKGVCFYKSLPHYQFKFVARLYELPKDEIAAWALEQGLIDTLPEKYSPLSDRVEVAWAAAHDVKLRGCRRCPAGRSKRNGCHAFGYPVRGTGEVNVWQERLVWIGTILWPADTKFDSRFGYGGGRSLHQCGLCAKGINLSGRVPVTGTGADGVPHGMFVGEDCARKFVAGVETLKKDHFLADNLVAATAAATAEGQQ